MMVYSLKRSSKERFEDEIFHFIAFVYRKDKVSLAGGREMLIFIEQITKTSEKQQSQLLLGLSKLPTKIRLELFEEHKTVFYKLKQTYVEISPPILSYCALLVVLAAYKNNQEMLQQKNFNDLSMEEILNLSLQRITLFKQSKQRRKLKYDLVLDHWSLIETLVSEGVSFRGISDYLKKYHRLHISYSTIYLIYKKIKGI